MTDSRQHLHAVIVDDEEPGRDALRAALGRCDGIDVVAECADGVAAIEIIRTRQPDVVFLDVQMPEVDGFGVILGVGADRMPPVVLVTAHDRFAVKAFDVHAVDYLLKPFTDSRVNSAVNRVRAALARDTDDDATLAKPHEYASRLLVKKGDRVKFVPVAAVDYFESDGAYVHLQAGAEKHSVRRTLKDVQAQLDPSKFVRIHRSFIVNLERVKEVQPYFSGDYVALLTTGAQLRVSRLYRDHLLRPQF